MAYRNVWWYPNYTEYGSGVKDGKTWLQVQDQYRRPNAIYDLRRYDIPIEDYQSKLYYRLPRLGQPEYRATFRDRPHTLPRHYPSPDPRAKAPGFHGRVYMEYGPTQFKYEGPYKDDLHWLEREPYLPAFVKSRKDEPIVDEATERASERLKSEYRPCTIGQIYQHYQA